MCEAVKNGAGRSGPPWGNHPAPAGPLGRAAQRDFFTPSAKREARLADLAAGLRTTSLSSQGKQETNSLKLKERSWNVYENKGPLWKTSERS